MKRTRARTGLWVLAAWSGVMLIRDAWLGSTEWSWSERIFHDFWGGFGLQSLFLSANQLSYRPDSWFDPTTQLDAVPGLIESARLFFPHFMLIMAPLVLATVALRRRSTRASRLAGATALLHPLLYVLVFAWFGSSSYIESKTGIPRTWPWQHFLPGLLWTSALPVAGAVLAFRGGFDEGLRERAAVPETMPSPIG